MYHSHCPRPDWATCENARAWEVRQDTRGEGHRGRRGKGVGRSQRRGEVGARRVGATTGARSRPAPGHDRRQRQRPRHDVAMPKVCNLACPAAPVERVEVGAAVRRSAPGRDGGALACQGDGGLRVPRQHVVRRGSLGWPRPSLHGERVHMGERGGGGWGDGARRRPAAAAARASIGPRVTTFGGRARMVCGKVVWAGCPR